MLHNNYCNYINNSINTSNICVTLNHHQMSRLYTVVLTMCSPVLIPIVGLFFSGKVSVTSGTLVGKCISLDNTRPHERLVSLLTSVGDERDLVVEESFSRRSSFCNKFCLETLLIEKHEIYVTSVMRVFCYLCAVTLTRGFSPSFCGCLLTCLFSCLTTR